MPDLDGFGVVEEVGVERMPTIVFVTAFDEFALRAFELHALDYILKPFTSERFQKALERARSQIQQASMEDVNQRLLALLREARPRSTPDKYLERIVVKIAGRIFFLNTDEIDWVEAADNYVRLHTGKESYLVQGTMSKLESKLDPKRFLRIHRSTIVNITRTKELQPLFHGEYAILLTNGKELTSSRRYRDRLQQLLDNAF
jgi:two-component system LytT family response regulator